MLRHMPIRLRLTALSVLLLALCCAGLTVALNLSAGRMANVIEATLVMPAQQVPPEALTQAGLAAGDLAPSLPVEGSQAARSDFLQQSVVGMLLVVALGGVLTYFVAGRALRPLQVLSKQMKNRTVHNLSETLPVPESHDEIAALTQAFNEMSGTLEGAFAMQRRFSQSAAHELRTPLTVLKTKVAVFQKKQLHSPEEYDKLLATITTHTNRLADLVTDLLNLTNRDALDWDEALPLDILLTQVAGELEELAQAGGIALSVETQPQLVRGNARLLHRACYNLVENAIAYNRPGGQVQVRLAATDGHSVVTISDTGIGIPPSAQALIFEPFYRVEQSRSRQRGGAGLGLATVKAIVAQHGGTITVAENPGGGTRFVLTL